MFVVGGGERKMFSLQTFFYSLRSIFIQQNENLSRLYFDSSLKELSVTIAK